jgi:hypothetical protein
MIDIYSRYTVAWMVAPNESEALAEQFLTDAVAKQGIGEDEVTIHSDRGAIQTARSVQLMLADLGVAKSYSRPKTSNDNPYSEAHFKTLKYRPDYPGRFGSIQDARAWAAGFFRWYHFDHRHSGIGMHTPSTTAWPTPSAASAPSSWPRPTPAAPSASPASHRRPRSSPKPLGQTSRHPSSTSRQRSRHRVRTSTPTRQN